MLTGSRAVPPPALKFLVERTPLIVAMDGDTAIVGHLVVDKRNDTGAVNKLWKREKTPDGRPAHSEDSLSDPHRNG